jgi:hypothetical protein
MSEENNQERRSPGRPKKASAVEREIEKIQDNFDDFDENVKSLTHDRLNETPKAESEPQTKMSQKEMSKNNELYLKPKRAVSSKEKFNEKYRSEYNFAKEYVNFIAENKEIVGEAIEMWTKPFAGMPAEEWSIPVNKPLWAPRYVAEQLKRKYYHRLTMDESRTTASDGNATYYGQMVVDTTVPRLDAYPVTKKKSLFMGGSSF